MYTEYHKLVRDRIPAIIRTSGSSCDIAIMNEEEYQQALIEKLVEEACEVREAAKEEKDRLVTELADLYEVIDALLLCYGIEDEMVRSMQKQRRKERGGFEQRIKLLSVSSQKERNATEYQPE